MEKMDQLELAILSDVFVTVASKIFPNNCNWNSGSNRVSDFKSAECDAELKLRARVPLKCTTISPGRHNFQRPFPMSLSLEGILYGGKFALQN